MVLAAFAAASAVVCVALEAADATASFAELMEPAMPSGRPIAELAVLSLGLSVTLLLAVVLPLGTAKSPGKVNAEPVLLLAGALATEPMSESGKVKPLVLGWLLLFPAKASDPAGAEVDGTLIGGIAVGRGVG